LFADETTIITNTFYHVNEFRKPDIRIQFFFFDEVLSGFAVISGLLTYGFEIASACSGIL
jgi:hypothetical protein